MALIHSLIAILGVTGSVSATQPEQEYENPFPFPAVITACAEVFLISGPRVYSDVFELTFTLPDIPDDDVIPSVQCDIDSRFMIVSCDPKKAAEDEIDKQYNESEKVITVLKKLFTKSGVGSYPRNIPRNPTIAIQDTQDANQDIKKVGIEWYANAKTVLDDRKLRIVSPINSRSKRELGNSSASLSRPPRQILQIFKKGAQYVLPAIAEPALDYLFVSADKIFKSSVNSRSNAPPAAKIFTDFQTSTSEYAHIEKESNKAKHISNRNMLKKVGEYEKSRPSVTAAEVKQDLSLLSRISKYGHLKQSNLLFALGSLQGHMSMLQDCRNQNIPLVAVPPAMLRDRLRDVESVLPLELVIGHEEADLYYALQNSAYCTFDDNGGIVRVKVYDKSKESRFEIFKFQPMGFAYQDHTCDFGVSSSYVIRDSTVGAIYPVSMIDQEECNPRTKPLCRLPEVASADLPHHYCLMTLLQGGTAAEVKSACPLTCRPGTRMSVALVDESTYVLTYLPKSGSEIRCEDGFLQEFLHNVDVGALRFRLNCGCSLYLNGRVILKPSGRKCSDLLPKFEVEHLIALQHSTLRNWVPNIDQIFREIKYIDSNCLIDYDIKVGSDVDKDSNSYLDFRFPIYSLFFVLLQFLIMMSLLAKYKLGPFAFLQAIPVVESSRLEKVNCVINSELSILLYIFIGLIVFIYGGKLLLKAFKKCQTCYAALIRIEAKK